MLRRLSIGEVAKATGIKVVTLRYYEQLGLLPAPARTSGNYRAYTEESLRRLRFIRRCRDLGFTLDQVRELLRLSTRKYQKCSEVDRITRRHLSDVEEKLGDLKRLAGVLRKISSRCRGDGLIANCRIIEALSPGRGGMPSPGSLRSPPSPRGRGRDVEGEPNPLPAGEGARGTRAGEGP